MRHIEALLRKEIGLDAASIGSTLIERSIRLRMKRHGLSRITDYEKLLTESRAELDALTEDVVVTETWFFRDREPFAAFTKLLLGDWLVRHPDRAARILSVPCSSGEEPYSLAMALLDAGIAPERFYIHGVDISAHALGRAERAVYGRNSFRGKDLEFRDRYFVPMKDGYGLNPEVRQQVVFGRANILDEDFLAESEPYDFVFCRNLLIYFDRTTQILALAKIHRILATDGHLFVGPAEMPMITESGFISAKIPHAFACRKTSQTTFIAARPKLRRGATARSIQLRRQPNQPFLPAKSAVVKLTTKPEANREELLRARAHANSGRLDQAAALCQMHLARHADCAEGYYLLGLVKDAANDPEAIVYYRKALYLDPNHYEALLHAALWLEKAGDSAAARPLKRRAERVQPNKS